MNNTEIYFVRHGLPEYKYNEKGEKMMYGLDAPLSKEGEIHVKAIAQKLPPLDIICTSPFVRTQETAKLLANALNNPAIILYDFLKDSYSRNSPGRTLADTVAGRIPPHPDDETFEQLYTRVIGGFNALLEESKGKRIGVVSHGHPIRLVIWHHVEKQKNIPSAMEELVRYNYPLQAEAWRVIWDEQMNVVESRLLTRDDNNTPGVGKW